MKCPFCQTELLGQENYPLKRCDQCNLWFELGEGELVPLRADSLYIRR
jgi:hypothetical protein